MLIFRKEWNMDGQDGQDARRQRMRARPGVPEWKKGASLENAFALGASCEPTLLDVELLQVASESLLC
jgi:hypothetical protein